MIAYISAQTSKLNIFWPNLFYFEDILPLQFFVSFCFDWNNNFWAMILWFFRLYKMPNLALCISTTRIFFELKKAKFYVFSLILSLCKISLKSETKVGHPGSQPPAWQTKKTKNFFKVQNAIPWLLHRQILMKFS